MMQPDEGVLLPGDDHQEPLSDSHISCLLGQRRLVCSALSIEPHALQIILDPLIIRMVSMAYSRWHMSQILCILSACLESVISQGLCVPKGCITTEPPGTTFCEYSL